MAVREPPDGSGRRQRWGWWIAAGLLVLLLVVGLVVLWVQAPALYGRGDAAKTAAATTRSAILTVAAALIAATAAGAGLYVTARTIRINQQMLAETERADRASDDREREAQVTDRYTKAIDQLGSAQLDVRLGGIYALERIAIDSERDHPIVVEVLGAFVRGHSASRYQYIQAGRPGWQSSTDEDEEQRLADAYVAGLKSPPADVQAAVSVLGRLPSRRGVPRGDLGGAQLSKAQLGGADLSDADLGGAKLSKADLGGAKLSKARLEGAELPGAQLTGARLNGADLSKARLNGADLSDADLGGAKLSKAQLEGAKLSKARLNGADLCDADLGWTDLSDADLDGAKLSKARLNGAELPGARLGGADLSDADLGGAKQLTEEQLDSAVGNMNTKLPDGYKRPASWLASTR